MKKTKQLLALLLSVLFLLSFCSCGKKDGGKTQGDLLNGKIVSIDTAGMENECFFGSTEEIRGLYDALAEGDEGVKKYVAAREEEHEYLDDLSLVDSAAKARYLLKDILDRPIAVFPEENFKANYYMRTVNSDESTTLSVYYVLSEHWHYGKMPGFSVTVNYNDSQQMLESRENNNGHATPVETVEIDGNSMNIYVMPSSTASSGFTVQGTILLDGSLTTITIPVEDADSGSSGVREAVAKLHKMRITTLREELGIEKS